MRYKTESISNPLLDAQTHSKDDVRSHSWCPDCCLFPVISPSGNNANARLHGTLVKDVPWIAAVFVTLAVLIVLIAGLLSRHHGADALVVNVNIGQFNLISALMLLTWFGWGYALCSKVLHGYSINYVVTLNLDLPPFADPARPPRHLSALGVARLTSAIALSQGISLGFSMVFWRYLSFSASSAVGCMLLCFHICFLLVPRGFERDSRMTLRTTLLRCFAAPFCHVFFLDNIVGDVLTSAQSNFPVLLFSLCFEFSGHVFVIHSFFSVAITRISLSLCTLFEGLWWVNDFSPSFGSTAPSISSSTVCSSRSDFQLFYFIPIISIFPFWIRFFQVVFFWLLDDCSFKDFHPFVQCMRKWWDTRHCSGWENTGNLINAGKYFSCIFLVLVDVLQKWSPGVTTLGLWIASAIIKTMFVYF